MAHQPRIVVSNDAPCPEDVETHYFNVVGPDRKDPLSVKIHSSRKHYYEEVLAEARKLTQQLSGPNKRTEITPQNVSDLLNVLIMAGVPQSHLAQVFQTSKTTIARWARMENPPRPNLRRMIIEESIGMLSHLVLRKARAA